MEEIKTLRNPRNPPIGASIGDILKMTEGLNVLPAGEWAVHHWVTKWSLTGAPSIDVDFLAKLEDFKRVDSTLRELGYKSSRYREVIRDKQLPFLEERLNLDLLFDKKPSKLSFKNPYVRPIFKKEYYSTKTFRFKGLSSKVKVVPPKALVVLKLDMYSRPNYPDEKEEKHWKDIVNIYSPLMDTPKLNLNVFGELHRIKPPSPGHIERFFSEESREIMDVATVITNHVDLSSDREGFLTRIDEIKEFLGEVV